jgi:hypothetical protein
MKFDVKCDLEYIVAEPGTFILNVQALAQGQNIIKELCTVENGTYKEFASFPEGNRLMSVSVSHSAMVNIKYSAIVENSCVIVDMHNVKESVIADLASIVLMYLHPSRYCQSDQLFRFAEHQFGRIEGTFNKVTAINNWINYNVEYLSGSTNVETSAYDTVIQQAGVCRDFAHLGIALCRALTIPARYCAVYAYQLQPQDFHACYEAYIGGSWIMFDATRLAPVNGLVKIAHGRDAADTAISNLFGDMKGNGINVNSQLHDGDFSPFYYFDGEMKGACYA